MKKIAQKYNLDFALYATKNEDVGVIYFLQIYKSEVDPLNLVFTKQSWGCDTGDNADWLFFAKMKKNEYIEFLIEIKEFINNNIIPKEKVFCSYESDLLLLIEIDAVNCISEYMNNYRIEEFKQEVIKKINLLDESLQSLISKTEELEKIKK